MDTDWSSRRDVPEDSRRSVIAQANVAWLRWPLDSPKLDEFHANLGLVNAAARESAGFIWAPPTTTGDYTSIRVFDDPRILFNMSLWESIEDLYRFTYSGSHAQLFRKRATWFARPPKEPLVMWWIESFARPSVSEACERLELLWNSGAGPMAFTFRKAFGPDGNALPADSRRHWRERGTSATEGRRTGSQDA